MDKFSVGVQREFRFRTETCKPKQQFSFMPCTLLLVHRSVVFNFFFFFIKCSKFATAGCKKLPTQNFEVIERIINFLNFQNMFG